MSIEKVKKTIQESNNIVFFGGAGVSTESGIPDFRSIDGIYQENYMYPPEIMLSHSFFLSNTKDFYKFYKEKMINLNAEPNLTHKKLAQLEKEKKLRAVITQNIDGLHQLGGSKEVIELHGSIYRNYCMRCHKAYQLQSILDSEEIPKCSCGGIIKPDVVLYEESLDEELLEMAVSYISTADVLIVGGTSLSVYPAAGLLKYYKGSKLILINKATTDYDTVADIVMNESIGKIFSLI